MAPQKVKKTESDRLEVVTEGLKQLRLALGRAVIVLTLTQEALPKDKTTLRVNALQLGDKIRDLQRRQRLIFGELQKTGVLPRDKTKRQNKEVTMTSPKKMAGADGGSTLEFIEMMQVVASHKSGEAKNAHAAGCRSETNWEIPTRI